MRGGCHVEANSFVVARGVEKKGIKMGDVASGGLASVGEDEGYWMRLWKTGELVALRQLVINEATLTPTIYQCPSGYSFLRLRCLEFHVDVSEGGILRGV